MKKGMRKLLPGNKKGAEMAVGTIVIIVLAVLVLVFLIWGFSAGWSNLWSKITSYIGGGSNVADIKQACMLACDGGQANEYCLNVRSVKLDGGKVVKGSCKNFEGQNDVIPGLNCGSITCPENGVYKQTCSDMGGSWIYSSAEGCGSKIKLSPATTTDRYEFIDAKGKQAASGTKVGDTNSFCCK
jgi:hypothetical protein